MKQLKLKFHSLAEHLYHADIWSNYQAAQLFAQYNPPNIPYHYRTLMCDYKRKIPSNNLLRTFQADQVTLMARGPIKDEDRFFLCHAYQFLEFAKLNQIKLPDIFSSKSYTDERYRTEPIEELVFNEITESSEPWILIGALTELLMGRVPGQKPNNNYYKTVENIKAQFQEAYPAVRGLGSRTMDTKIKTGRDSLATAIKQASAKVSNEEHKSK